MAGSHVIAALREKRDRVSAIVARLERQLDQHRADLTHIDGVLRLFEPDSDPKTIKPKRSYARRTRYFGRGEAARLCRESLRDCGRLSVDDIVAKAIDAKGLDRADSVLRGVRWKLTPSDPALAI